MEKLAFNYTLGDPNDDPTGHLENIQEHCKKLLHLDSHSSVDYQVQMSKLLCSYGEKLEYANLYGMGENEIRGVVNVCLNARFYLQPPVNSQVLPLLQILEHQSIMLRSAITMNSKRHGMNVLIYADCALKDVMLMT